MVEHSTNFYYVHCATAAQHMTIIVRWSGQHAKCDAKLQWSLTLRMQKSTVIITFVPQIVRKVSLPYWFSKDSNLEIWRIVFSLYWYPFRQGRILWKLTRPVIHLYTLYQDAPFGKVCGLKFSGTLIMNFIFDPLINGSSVWPSFHGFCLCLKHLDLRQLSQIPTVKTMEILNYSNRYCLIKSLKVVLA